MLLVANLATQNNAKNLKNYWNPDTCLVIWDYSARTFKWIQHDLVKMIFIISGISCALDEKVKRVNLKLTLVKSSCHFLEEVEDGFVSRGWFLVLLLGSHCGRLWGGTGRRGSRTLRDGYKGCGYRQRWGDGTSDPASSWGWGWHQVVAVWGSSERTTWENWACLTLLASMFFQRVW